MVTANRTSDGIVIYRTAQQGWSASLSDAAIVRTSDEARALLNEANADDVGAIGAYIAPVELKDSGEIKPGNLRERILIRDARRVGSVRVERRLIGVQGNASDHGGILKNRRGGPVRSSELAADLDHIGYPCSCGRG